MTVVTYAFDYEALEPATRDLVERKSAEIRDRIGRAAQNVVEIGTRLIEVKERLDHGQFGDWLDAEFDWSERTAQNMIRVAETFGAADFADLSIGPSALYLLASPSTPEDVREEYVERARAGEAVSHGEVRRAVDEAKDPDDGDEESLPSSSGETADSDEDSEADPAEDEPAPTTPSPLAPAGESGGPVAGHPPARMLAEAAIDRLRLIAEDDPERDEALLRVRAWIDERLPNE